MKNFHLPLPEQTYMGPVSYTHLVISVNTPDFQEGSEKQMGSKPGTAGPPLPGVAVKVVDAQTGAPLPPNSEGLLLSLIHI